MQKKPEKALVALLLVFAWACSPNFAVTPDIRLPEWKSVSIRFTDFEPISGILQMEVMLKSQKVPLRDLSVSVKWPEGFKAKNEPAKLSILGKDQEWKTNHSSVAPKEFDGWIELEILGRPDQTAMKALLLADKEISGMRRNLLLAEVQQFSKPMNFGQGIPLHLDRNIAGGAPADFLFAPLWPVDGRYLHLWAPEGDLGEKEISESFVGFRKAIQNQNLNAALLALGIIEERLKGREGSIELKKSADTVLQIPMKTALDGITLDRASLSGLKSPQEGISALGKILKNPEPVFGSPFGWANLGILQAQAGKPGLSVESWKNALDQLPSWPLVRSWSQKSGRSK